MNLSALTLASGATFVSQYTPDEYERTSYYNGRITGDGDHPELVYRSDFITTPFPKPVGRHTFKSLRGVFGTSLNGVWCTVDPEICNLIKAWKINWSSIATLPASSPTDRQERRRGVSVPSSYGSVLFLVLAPPIPPTGSPRRSLRFSRRTESGGNPSDKVYGVSNCHVLRKDTAVKYE